MNIKISNQVVSLNDGIHPQRYFRCVKGSGMGLTSSGEISDATLLELMELPSIALSTFRDLHGIKAYFRFKDDILILIDVVDPDAHALKIKERLSSLSKEFKLKMITVSRAVDFLDLSLSFDLNGFLTYNVFIKESRIGRPLCVTSMHHPSVHLSWPVAEVRRLRARCLSHVSSNFAIASFKEKLNRESINHPALLADSVVARRSVVITENKVFRRIVLPYHPSLCGLVPICARHLIDISWSNGGTHYVRALKSLRPKVGTDVVRTWLYGADSADGGGTFVFCSKNSKHKKSHM